MLDRWHLPFLGILIQGIVVAVGFLIFLGRLYVVELYGALRIPLHEVSVGTTDYALVSPPVSILAVGFLAIPLIYVVFQPYANNNPLSPLAKIALSISALVLMVILLGIVVLIPSLDPILRSILVVLLVLCSVAFPLFGGLGVLLDEAPFLKGGALTPGDAEITAGKQRVAFGKIFTGIWLVVVVVGMLFFGMVLASNMGQEDATNIREREPGTTVKLETAERCVTLLHANDRFLFVLEDSSTVAYPLRSVSRIIEGCQLK